MYIQVIKLKLGHTMHSIHMYIFKINTLCIFNNWKLVKQGSNRKVAKRRNVDRATLLLIAFHHFLTPQCSNFLSLQSCNFSKFDCNFADGHSYSLHMNAQLIYCPSYTFGSVQCVGVTHTYKMSHVFFHFLIFS